MLFRALIVSNSVDTVALDVVSVCDIDCPDVLLLSLFARRRSKKPMDTATTNSSRQTPPAKPATNATGKAEAAEVDDIALISVADTAGDDETDETGEWDNEPANSVVSADVPSVVVWVIPALVERGAAVANVLDGFAVETVSFVATVFACFETVLNSTLVVVG